MGATRRTTLPLLVIGASMVAAAVLPAVGQPTRASAATPAVSPTAAALLHRQASAAHRPVKARPSAKPTRANHHAAPRATAQPTRPAASPRAGAAPRVSHAAAPDPAPTATHTAAGRRTHHSSATKHATAPVSGPTGWGDLNAAIAQIPTYHAGMAHWVISAKYGHWGTADWYHATMYIAPDVPTNMLFNVVVHEWSHELSVLDYNGNVAAATNAMNHVFGGSGLVGAERAADCMSRLQGATWTHYTSCSDHSWRSAAARLIAGKQL
jgi:hypothetical protein